MFDYWNFQVHSSIVDADVDVDMYIYMYM